MRIGRIPTAPLPTRPVAALLRGVGAQQAAGARHNPFRRRARSPIRAAGSHAQEAPLMAEITDPENTILMELKSGTVTIALLPDIAPRHCARIKELARAGAYDGVVFHRVIDRFMAQTGDVQHGRSGGDLRRAGTGGSDLPDLPAEFSGVAHDRGTLGAARSQNPNSANSQFFINFSDNHFLNRQYTVYGRVIAGMEHVDAITRGEPPANPDVMVSVKVAADA